MEDENKRLYQETQLDNGADAESPPNDEAPPTPNDNESETNEHAHGSSVSYTRHQKLTFVAAMIASLSSAMAFSVISVFFPLVAKKSGMSQTVVGFVFTAFSFAATIGSPIWGKVMPLIGARFVFLSGIFITGGCNILFGFVNDMPDITTFTAFAFAIRIVEGLGTSAVWTSSAAISAYAFPDNVGTVVSLIEMASGLSFAIGPAIGGLLYNAGGFRLPFFVLGGLVLAIDALNVFLMPQQGSKNEETGSIVQVLSVPAIWMTLSVIFVGSVALSFIDPTLSLHLKRLNFNVIETSLLFVGLGLSYAIFSVFWGAIADAKKTTRIMIAMGAFGTGVFFLLLGPSPLLKITPNQLLAIFALPFGGFVVGLITMPSFVDMFVSAEWYGIASSLGITSIISGVFTSAFSLGTIIGPLLGASLTGSYGFGFASTVMAGLCFLVSICVCLFGVWEYRCGKGRRVPRKRLEHDVTSADDLDANTPLFSRDV